MGQPRVSGPTRGGHGRRASVLAVVAALSSGSGFACCFCSDEPDVGDELEGACRPGMPGCPCTTEGACDPSFLCDESLFACIATQACEIGSPGCACTDADTCEEDLVCEEELCLSELPCHPERTGFHGCQCTENGGCDPGLTCAWDRCVPPEREC
jgi:hypothetical protein